jgi:hypothetical protein
VVLLRLSIKHEGYVVEQTQRNFDSSLSWRGGGAGKNDRYVETADIRAYKKQDLLRDHRTLTMDPGKHKRE